MKNKEQKNRVVVPYRDIDALEKFLSQPKKVIAEDIVSGLTGVFASGSSGIVLAASRIVQGALKGRMMAQAGKEIREFIEKGKLKEDYAETKYGFQSLAELLNFIDSEAPDEDRFEAVKAMFFVLNSVDTKQSNEMLSYQLFKLSMKLSSSQLFLLKLSYVYYKENGAFSNSSHNEWVKIMAEKAGHQIYTLVIQDEKSLMDNGLLSERKFPDESGIHAANARLTDLGIKFCEYLVQYEEAKNTE